MSNILKTLWDLLKGTSKLTDEEIILILDELIRLDEISQLDIISQFLNITKQVKGLQPVNFKRKLNRITFNKPALVKILQKAFNKLPNFWNDEDRMMSRLGFLAASVIADP